MGDRIAIIDAPENGNSVSFLTNPTTGYVNTLGSPAGHAAAYSPWYLASVVLQNGNIQQIYIPPSGGVAGVYARVDRERGVHKPPAGESLLDALSLKVDYTSEELSELTVFNVNPLLSTAPNSVLIWGARTTSSDLNLKYVSVSRLLMYIKESIEEGTQWVASEINAEPLWIRVRQRIDDFLYLNWQRGALMGTKADDAYFVRCDATTMTASDISNGRLKCFYGVAVTRSAEFETLWLEQNTL
jgi:phage tail sheath protein FI